MATLPSGAPYMLGTDAANTIDTYTLDNANYWDDRTPAKVLSGTVSVTAPNATPGTTTVTFASAFGSAPVVVVTLNTGYSFQVNVSALSASTTGFTFRAYQSSGSSQTINANWIAVEL